MTAYFSGDYGPSHPQFAMNCTSASSASAFPPNQPTAIDLFAGAGGLTVGLKEAGFRVLGAVELDHLAVEAYRKNHPDVKIWETDIRQLDTEQFISGTSLCSGQIDLLAGCPPCQGFSRLRTLRGKKQISDDRNDLLYDFLRFAQALLPKTLMMENVPPLIEDGRFHTMVAILKHLGYHCRVDILDTAEFGVPQRRKRLVLIASRHGEPSFAPASDDVATVRSTIEHLSEPTSLSDDLLHRLSEKRSKKIKRLIRDIPHDGGSRSDLSKRRQLGCHKRCDGFRDIYGRMKWDDVSPTITTGFVNPSKGRFLHPEQDRCITLREGALLQTFPADYIFPLNRGKFAAAALIGNAIPPEFIRRHAESLKKNLENA